MEILVCGIMIVTKTGLHIAEVPFNGNVHMELLTTIMATTEKGMIIAAVHMPS